MIEDAKETRDASLAARATLLVVACALIVGCHRTRPATAIAPSAWPEEGHCWWSSFRTAMPPDSVAERFAGAYASLGLTETGWSHQADTAWAEGGPTVLARSAGTGTYAARVVAYRHGDTTFFRSFVGTRPVGMGNIGSLGIPFCGDASRAAKTGGLAPRTEEPEDSLPRWRRRPTH